MYKDIISDLRVSESCKQDIISIVEDIIDFNKKKQQRTIDKNAEKINQMMLSGELDAVRQLPNGKIMGPPKLVNDLLNKKKETQDAVNNLNNKKEDKDNG